LKVYVLEDGLTTDSRVAAKGKVVGGFEIENYIPKQ
jgi:hypothetical protein